MTVLRSPFCLMSFRRARLLRRLRSDRSPAPPCRCCVPLPRPAETIPVLRPVDAAIAFTSHLLVLSVAVLKRGFGTRRSAINRTPVFVGSQKILPVPLLFICCARGGGRTHIPFGNTILSGARLPITPPRHFIRVPYLRGRGEGCRSIFEYPRILHTFFILSYAKSEGTGKSRQMSALDWVLGPISDTFARVTATNFTEA